MKVLVTGGAGFIGVNLVHRLLREGCEVTVLDNFSSQVHGGNAQLTPDLAHDVRLVVGDVRDSGELSKALNSQDIVVHLAAETGTGQSMYKVQHYESVNVGGTAALVDYLSTHKSTCVRRVVLASSRAVYGEGQYRCSLDGIVFPNGRKTEDMLAGRFEPLCPVCGADCIPEPTPEHAPWQPNSFYGLTKQVQEQMLSLFGEALQLPVIALRYQNVYGPGQSLRNPYTGILAIFSNLARVGQRMNIFEDGCESRDFVYIDDVVEATWRATIDESARREVLNVGTGTRTTVLEVAKTIAGCFSSDAEVCVTGAFRPADVRHNYADISRIRARYGFQAKWTFERGIIRFVEWAASQTLLEDFNNAYMTSLKELSDGEFYRE